METLIEQVLRSPKARLYAEEIHAALRLEESARQHFRDEFRDGEKAEFINGEVIVHSPAKSEHLDVVLRLASLLRTYVHRHRLGEVKSEKALIALTRNDYEPDICFWGMEKSSKFTPKQMIFPAPDLVVEVISPSTEARDRGVKFEDYAAHGTGEYWIIDPDAKLIEQYALRDGLYQRVEFAAGRIRSTAIDRLELPIAAVFDDPANLAALRQIVTG